MATNQGPSSTQDNVVKKFCYMPTAENAAGNESGVSTTAGMGTNSGTQAPFQNPSGVINGTASSADMSKHWQNGTQSVPEAGQNQYQ